MTDQITPVLVDPETGEVLDPEAALRRIATLIEVRDILTQDVGNLEQELRGKRQLVKDLRSQGDETNTELDKAAKEVYAYWRQKLRPSARAFGADRKKAVTGRLREYAPNLRADKLHEGVGELKRAIDGAQIGAYVDNRGVRHDDLELICRSPKYVEKFIAIADAASQPRETAQEGSETYLWTRQWSRNRRALLKALQVAFGKGHDDYDGAIYFPCPKCLNDPLTTVRIAAPGAYGVIARCVQCKATEYEFLKALRT
jgi:hypothetical protein